MRARSEIDSIEIANSSDPAAAEIQITAVAGGDDRIESVQLALKHAGAADIVLVHDAARALTPPEVFRRVAAAVRAGAEAVVPVLPMTDTVRRAERRRAAHSEQGRAAPRPATHSGSRFTAHSGSRSTANGRQAVVEAGAEAEAGAGIDHGVDQHPPTVEILHGDLDRSNLRRVQTPQGFAAATLRRAHESLSRDVAESDPRARAATDDAGLVESLGVDVVAVDGDEEALKITYPLDLVLGEHIARLRDVAAPGENTREGVTTRDETTRGETVRDRSSSRGEQ